MNGSHLLPNGKNRPVERLPAAISASAMPFLPFAATADLKSMRVPPQGDGLPPKGEAQGFRPLGLLPVCKVAQADIGSFLSDTVFGFEREDFVSPEPLFFSKQTAEKWRRSQLIVSLPEPLASKRCGFTLNRFNSGELTGARFFVGSDSQVSVSPRTGSVVTQSLTGPARTKIRRAIQNASHDFKCFMTVTFAPDLCKPWEKNADGSIRHDFAKYKIKKFLHSIKQACDRKADKSVRESDRIAYVWVAEVQKKTTNNIHFHILLNHRLPIKWLTALWSQASNSIDVRSINNLNHASCYIRKYMEKDKSAIQGNRYAITQGLRETMKPEKTTINGRELQKGVFDIIRELSDSIEINDGKVLDHGFYIPTPCRSVFFRGKDKAFHKTIAVSAGLSLYLLNEVQSLCSSLPF